MNTELSETLSPSHDSITFFRLPSRKSMLDWSISTARQAPTCDLSFFYLPLAGIRRPFSLQNSQYSPQPWPRSARCRSPEKTTHLARRRGGGMTARAKSDDENAAQTRATLVRVSGSTKKPLSQRRHDFFGDAQCGPLGVAAWCMHPPPFDQELNSCLPWPLRNARSHGNTSQGPRLSGNVWESFDFDSHQDTARYYNQGNFAHTSPIPRLTPGW